MQEISLDEIRTKALAYNAADKQWHFHILSPTCRFNASDKYAFTIEDSDNGELFVYYSGQAEKTVGRELAPLLHKVVASGGGKSEPTHESSPIVQKIIQRMQALNQAGIEWHHHVLFPDCIFNTHSPKFALVLEDPETGETFESLTDEEPAADIRSIEPLFYAK